MADLLWGKRAKFSYLFIASLLLLFTSLGGRELWTQEHRWADIVFGMFYRQDFLHPYLGGIAYYDKPLLSYWLIALIAKLSHGLTTWALRLPSALAGMLAIWSIYRLGTLLKNKQLGLLAGWLLLTTYYFVFWARISSADMLNLAGCLFAISWYMDHRDTASLFDYSIFFIILAATSLCKGLIGAIIPLLAVATDIYLQKSWQQHFRLPLFLALIPALIIYLIPFWASSHMGGGSYHQNGLYLVYRENFLRYFQPFDHKGPLYTYFLYLPIYVLPHAIFFIPALWMLKSRFASLTLNMKWLSFLLLFLFLFFTLAGSRRSHYVLPIVPFAILFTADWILSRPWNRAKQTGLAWMVIISFIILFITVDVLPAIYYAEFGLETFATILKSEANKIKPWGTWNVVLLDGESKLNYYLRLPPQTPALSLLGTERDVQTAASLAKAWPILKNKPVNTIFVTRKRYEAAIASYFNDYRKVELPARKPWPFLKNQEENAPVAFIPLSHPKTIYYFK